MSVLSLWSIWIEIVNFVFCILSWKPKTVCRPVSSVEAKILRIHVQRLLSLWSQLYNRWAVAYGLGTCSFQSSKVDFFFSTIFSKCCYITNFELEIICFMSLRLDWIMKMITFQVVYHLHRLTRKYLDQQTSSSNLWYLLLRFSPTFMQGVFFSMVPP